MRAVDYHRIFNQVPLKINNRLLKKSSVVEPAAATASPTPALGGGLEALGQRMDLVRACSGANSGAGNGHGD